MALFGITYRFGFKTFLFHIFERSIFGVLLFIIAIALPAISRFIIVSAQIEVTDPEIINRLGNAVQALLFLLALLAVALAVVSSYITHISHTYTLEEHGIRYRKGFLSKYEIFTPYKQVQTVDLNQSIFMRIVGIARMTIFVAGDDNPKDGQADQIFELMDIDRASSLREELLQLANVQRVVNVTK